MRVTNWLPAAGVAVALLLGVAVAINAVAAVALLLAPLAGWTLLSAGAQLSTLASAGRLLAAFSLVLVLAPTVLPAPEIMRLAVLVPFGAFVVLQTRGVPLAKHAGLSVAIYVAVVALSLLRGVSSGAWGTYREAAVITATMVTLMLFALSLARGATTPEARRANLTAIAMAPGIFAFANVMLWLIGDRLPIISMPDQASLAAGLPASILRAAGFDGAIRTQMPLSSGINSMGAIAATAIVMSGVLARRSAGSVRIAHLGLVASAFTCAILSDSRIALGIGIFVLVVLLTVPRARASGGFAALMPLAPIAFVLVLGWLANSRLADILSRSGNDFATGTGRTTIWNGILDSTLSTPVPSHLIGYGANGQITSGAIDSYAFVFRDFEGTFTAHDLYLQAILDIGYVGLAALLYAVFVAARRLSNSDFQPIGNAVAAALFVLLLAGITEALPSPYFPDVLYLFVLLLCADAGRRTDERGMRTSASQASSGQLASPALSHAKRST